LDIGSYFFVARSYDGKLESGDSNEVQVSFSACSQAALIRSGEGIQYIDVKDLPPEELPSKNLPSRE
jgi:hypothetical protein